MSNKHISPTLKVSPVVNKDGKGLDDTLLHAFLKMVCFAIEDILKQLVGKCGANLIDRTKNINTAGRYLNYLQKILRKGSNASKDSKEMIRTIGTI